MERPPNSRTVVLIGLAVALLAGLAFAFVVLRTSPKQDGPPPASQGGLVVEVGRDEDLKLDPKRPLRCFVDGQLVGMLTLDECAKRNGVLGGALDVGIDETGALAAADEFGTILTPVPPQEPGSEFVFPPPGGVLPPPAPKPAPIPDVQARGGPPATCWRYEGGWTRIGEMPLAACVQTLYAGRCERQGSAAYGRWGGQTVRLVTGKVEISPDDRTFRTLVEQGPGCTIPG